MTVLSGVDEAGAPALYDIPEGELSKYKLNLKPLTDEVRNRLFPGKDELTKDDAQGVVPVGRAQSEVEGYAAYCIYWIDDGMGNFIWWEAPC